MFQPGDTAFGIWDSDLQFQSDIDRFVEYVRLKLGAPVICVSLSASQIYEAFEDAIGEYSSLVNQFQAKSTLTQFLGTQITSTSGSENTYPSRLLEFEKKMAEPYGEEVGLNGSHPLYSGSITLHTGQQDYDLQALLSGTAPLTGANANTRIQIKEVLHFSPLAAFRLFNTTSAVNFLNAEFHFESYSPETVFYLLPIWEDVLRGMQFETSNRVRRSHYSYAIHNNVLTIYPVPTDDVNLWIKFMLPPNPVGDGLNKVANLSNVPFGFINYSSINSIGRQWIWRMGLAFAKETEGLIRRKMTTIPIPNGDLRLDGSELVSDARQEQEALRDQLKTILDELTYDKLAIRQMEMGDALEQQLKKFPMPIYVGSFLVLFLPFLGS